jgi:hypothetical protein
LGSVHGEEPAKIATEMGIGSAAIMAGKFGPRILERCGPQLAAGLAKMGVVASNPATSAEAKASVGLNHNQDTGASQ